MPDLSVCHSEGLSGVHYNYAVMLRSKGQGIIIGLNRPIQCIVWLLMDIPLFVSGHTPADTGRDGTIVLSFLCILLGLVCAALLIYICRNRKNIDYNGTL